MLTKNQSQKIIAAVMGFILVIAMGVAHAVVTEFDDIALDGENGSPFIQMDHPGQPDYFFVRFANRFAFYTGSTYSVEFYNTATRDTLVVDGNGVGIGTNAPTEKLHVEGNALITGNLELGSSRAIKGGITDLSTKEALDAVRSLQPVTFHYLHSPQEESVGFIAEDVPDLVATKARKSLSPMDMVAVLTKVVQEQQKTIESLSSKVAGLCAQQGCE